MSYIDVTYRELDELLHLLKFTKANDELGYIYSYPPLDAVIKLRTPQSSDEIVNGGILSGHAFILEQKGVITRANVLYKIIEHQRFLKENVLV
ncbi:MAG: hypothetical protein AAGI49_01590 [Bacteroidota bacterium]